jgi:hypothetical protein
MTDQIGKIFVKHITPNLVEVFTDKYKGVDGTKEPILLGMVYHYRTNIYEPKVLGYPDLYPDVYYPENLQQTDSLASAVKSIAHYFYTELRKQDFYVDQHGPIPDVDSLKPMDPTDNLKEEFITVKSPKFEIERIALSDDISETYNVIYYYIFDMNNHVYGLTDVNYPPAPKRPVQHLIGIVKCIQNNTTRQREVVSSIIRHNEHFEPISDRPKTLQEAIKRVIGYYLRVIKGLTKYWSSVPKNLRIDESLSVRVKEPDKISIGYGIHKKYMIYDSNQYIGEVHFRKDCYHAYSTHDNENVDPRHSEKVYGRFDKLNTAIQFLDKVHKYYSGLTKQIDESLIIKPLEDVDPLYNNNDRKRKIYAVLYSGRIIGEVMFSTDKYIAFSIHEHNNGTIYGTFTKLKDAIEFLRNTHNQNSKEVIRESLTVTPSDPTPGEVEVLNLHKIYTVKYNGIVLENICLHRNGEYSVVIIPNVRIFTKLNDAIQFICKIYEDKINELKKTNESIDVTSHVPLGVGSGLYNISRTYRVRKHSIIIGYIHQIGNEYVVINHHDRKAHKPFYKLNDAIRFLVDLNKHIYNITENQEYNLNLKIGERTPINIHGRKGVRYTINDIQGLYIYNLGHIIYYHNDDQYRAYPRMPDYEIEDFDSIQLAIQYLVDIYYNSDEGLAAWMINEEENVYPTSKLKVVKTSENEGGANYRIYDGSRSLGGIHYYKKEQFYIALPEFGHTSNFQNIKDAIEYILHPPNPNTSIDEEENVYPTSKLKVVKTFETEDGVTYRIYDDSRHLGRIYYKKIEQFYHSIPQDANISIGNFNNIKDAIEYILNPPDPDIPIDESINRNIKVVKTQENDVEIRYTVYEDSDLIGVIGYYKDDHTYEARGIDDWYWGTEGLYFGNIKDAVDCILNPPDPDMPIDESTINENQNVQVKKKYENEYEIVYAVYVDDKELGYIEYQRSGQSYASIMGHQEDEIKIEYHDNLKDAINYILKSKPEIDENNDSPDFDPPVLTFDISRVRISSNPLKIRYLIAASRKGMYSYRSIGKVDWSEKDPQYYYSSVSFHGDNRVFTNLKDAVDNVISTYRHWTTPKVPTIKESTDKKIVKKQPKYSVKRTAYGRIIGYDVYLGNKRIGSVEYFPKTQHPYIISAPEDIPDNESRYDNLKSAIQHIIKFHNDESQVSESKKYTPKNIKIEKLENDDSVIEYQMYDERRYLGTIFYMKHHGIYSATTPNGGAKFDIPSIKEAADWILKEQPMKESEENKVPKITKVKENEITCVYNVYLGKLVGTIYRHKSDNKFSVYRYNRDGTNYFHYKTTTTLQDAINSLLTK